MTIGLVRLGVVIAIAVTTATLGTASATAGAPPLQTDRGVVQSVTDTQLEVRALDGTVITLSVGPRTRVRLNRAVATLSQVRPGFVAEVRHRGDRPATVVRAFGKVPLLTDTGIVTTHTRSAITLRNVTADLTIPLDRATRFRRAGRRVGPGAARLGTRVTVRHREGEAARLVLVLGRP